MAGVEGLRHKKRLVYLRHQRHLFNLAVSQRAAKRFRRAARYSSVKNKKYDKRSGRHVEYFPCPESINLSANYNDTVEFLMKFRRWGDNAHKSSFYVDLRPLKEISPAGALLLASEFDRWVKIHGKKIRAVDAGEWNPAVRRLLQQMGFFQLLNVTYREPDTNEEALNREMLFLPFTAGDSTDGRHFIKLRNLIEGTVGKLGSRLALFQAVSEAVTNVLHHAYKNKRRISRWWMSASINFASSTITMMVLDHGAGIPRTLPRKGRREKVREFLNVTTLDGYVDDSKMIEAAVVLGRSSTGHAHRGHGLYRDIQHFVKSVEGVARLRIQSNRGSYIFTKNTMGERVSLMNHRNSLDGTLVEWKFELPQLGLPLI